MFFVLTIRNLWPLVRGREAVFGSERSLLAAGVMMSMVGYIVSAQFVSLQGLEVPYYFAFVGVGLVKRPFRPTVDEKQLVAPTPMSRASDARYPRPGLQPAPQLMTRRR